METCPVLRDKNWFLYVIVGWNLSRLDGLKFDPGKTGSCNHQLNFIFLLKWSKQEVTNKDTRFIVQEGTLQSWKHGWENLFTWWLHDPVLPGWNFNQSTRDRFHPTITWGNQFSSWQGGTGFHLIFVYKNP